MTPDDVAQAVNAITNHAIVGPKVAVILGSGLGPLADKLQGIPIGLTILGIGRDPRVLLQHAFRKLLAIGLRLAHAKPIEPRTWPSRAVVGDQTCLAVGLRSPNIGKMVAVALCAKMLLRSLKDLLVVQERV